MAHRERHLQSEPNSHYRISDKRYRNLQRENSQEFPLANNGANLESMYVYKHLGKILQVCLGEILEKRPHDPIEYMAQWIYKHRENELICKKEMVELIELENERREKEREDELLEMGRPDAPEPSSFHKFSSHFGQESSTVLKDISEQNVGRHGSNPSTKVKSEASISSEGQPNTTRSAKSMPTMSEVSLNIP